MVFDRERVCVQSRCRGAACTGKLSMLQTSSAPGRRLGFAAAQLIDRLAFLCCSQVRVASAGERAVKISVYTRIRAPPLLSPFTTFFVRTSRSTAMLFLALYSGKFSEDAFFFLFFLAWRALDASLSCVWIEGIGIVLS